MPEDNTETLTAKELTVEQVLEALDSMGNEEPHRMAILFPQVPIELVELSVGRRADELLKYPVSEIEKIVDAVKKVNPFFLKMTDRLLGKVPELKEVLSQGELKKPSVM